MICWFFVVVVVVVVCTGWEPGIFFFRVWQDVCVRSGYFSPSSDCQLFSLNLSSCVCAIFIIQSSQEKFLQ